MIRPSIPHDESCRLGSLRHLNILDTPQEERFDRLTRLVKRLFGVPIALVSLVDAHRQWFKSRQGLEVTETPREISFCGHAILEDDILVVPDARADRRFMDNPLVIEDPKIRFYAGCQLAAPNGSKVGTLCIIDRVPRNLDGDDLHLLHDVAGMAEQELATIQLATLDELTGLSNRLGFQAIARHAMGLCERLRRPASLLFFDLDRFKEINDDFGHAEGDRALIEISGFLHDCFRDSDAIARLGGDEFCVLFTGATKDEVSAPLRRLEEAIQARNAEPGKQYKLLYSVGTVAFDPERHASVADLMREADELMYRHKRSKVRQDKLSVRSLQ